MIDDSLPGDDSLGVMLPNPLGGLSGRPTLVVLMERPDGLSWELLCRLNRLAASMPLLEIVAVFPSSPREAFDRFLTLRRVRIVFDPVDWFGDRYRVTWAPRAYLLDRCGVLRWRQPSPDVLVEILLEKVAERMRV